MGSLVNLHYLDKKTFMNGNDDQGEEHMVFEYSPTYEDVVVKVRSMYIGWTQMMRLNLLEGMMLEWG